MRRKGYLLKDSAEVDLVRAVQVVAQGRPFFSPQIAQSLLEDYVKTLQQRGLQDSYDLLTDREREVLQLLAEGKSNKEVASILELSTYTVETHRTNLMHKLNLHNTAEIVLYAVRKKIIIGRHFRAGPGPSEMTNIFPLNKPALQTDFLCTLRISIVDMVSLKVRTIGRPDARPRRFAVSAPARKGDDGPDGDAPLW